MFPIFLVDDSREDLALEERILRQCRILNPIEPLNSGQACLDLLETCYAASAPKRPAPLIFVDIAMPETDGVQTIGAIQRLALNAAPFIVMVSGMADLKKVSEGYQQGARTFLAKPFQMPEVKLFLKAYEDAIMARLTANGLELHWG